MKTAYKTIILFSVILVFSLKTNAQLVKSNIIIEEKIKTGLYSLKKYKFDYSISTFMDIMNLPRDVDYFKQYGELESTMKDRIKSLIVIASQCQQFEKFIKQEEAKTNPDYVQILDWKLKLIANIAFIPLDELLKDYINSKTDGKYSSKVSIEYRLRIDTVYIKIPSNLKSLELDLSYNQYWWYELPNVWEEYFKKTLNFNKNPKTQEDFNRIFSINVVYIKDTISLNTLYPLQRLSNLEEIRCSKTKITSLNPLDSLKKLKKLDLAHCDSIKDFTPLKNLSNLKHLDISGTKINDLTSISDLVHLEYLNISNTSISDLAAISNLTNLKTLKCNNSKVTDISILQRFKDLDTLEVFNDNEVLIDFSPLKKLTEFKALKCSYNSIKEFKSLSNFKNFYLDLSSSKNENLDSLINLNNIATLNCSDCSKLKTLAGIENNKSLNKLTCQKTQIENLQPLSKITSLEELDCAENSNLKTLEGIENSLSLYSLTCSDTRIENLAPISNNNVLNILNCASTNITDLAPLANKCLKRLCLFNTSVDSLSQIRKSINSLTSLNITFTKLKNCEDELTRFVALRELYIGGFYLNESKFLDEFNGTIYYTLPKNTANFEYSGRLKFIKYINEDYWRSDNVYTLCKQCKE